MEAELGIPKNSKAEPDFLGWEVKQFGVEGFDRGETTKAITLMTPEPSGGYYVEEGSEAFVRKFGYPDRKGREDRLNFGGIHSVGVKCDLTGLTMQARGFDTEKREIVDANGAIELITPAGQIAAAWSFNKILEHWARKHMKAAYVPSIRRDEPSRQYAYGNRIRLAQGTDSLRLLAAFAIGTVYYDPGIKIERASTSQPKVKKRSQFRIASKNLSALYKTLESVEL